MFRRILSIRLFLLSFFIVVGLGAAFYLILGRNANSTIKQQLLQRQQTLARAEASNIMSFFQVFGDSVAVLSQLKSITSPDSAIWQMDVFVDQWRDGKLVGGVVLTDKNGVVVLNSNVLGTRDVGASLADRDYFLWAKGKPKVGEYFIGQPVVSRLGASKGQTIVPVASPVYKNGVFVGAIVASVKLTPLAEYFLGLMKVSDQTDVYLVDEKGDLLYSSSDRPLPELKNVPNVKEEGKLQISGRLVAYSPISLGSQNWLLAMATPVEEVSGITTPIYIRLTAMLLLVSLTFLLHGVVITREVQTKLG